LSVDDSGTSGIGNLTANLRDRSYLRASG
jgi:hypothetical protein